MDIKHHERGGRGVFLIRNDEGKRVAEMTYLTTGESEVTIDHTEVDEELRGRGVAKALLGEAVKFAREKDFKIRATCPFAHRQLQAIGEYSDVLAA